jgi:hypothetical protein
LSVPPAAVRVTSLRWVWERPTRKERRVAAFFAWAIEDALDLKRKEIELLEIPLSPSRLFELIPEANKI